MADYDPGEEYAMAVLNALETGEDITPKLRKPRSDVARLIRSRRIEETRLRRQAYSAQLFKIELEKWELEKQLNDQTVMLARVMLVAAGDSHPIAEWRYKCRLLSNGHMAKEAVVMEAYFEEKRICYEMGFRQDMLRKRFIRKIDEYAQKKLK
jgi:hypothetical protein